MERVPHPFDRRLLKYLQLASASECDITFEWYYTFLLSSAWQIVVLLCSIVVLVFVSVTSSLSACYCTLFIICMCTALVRKNRYANYHEVSKQLNN